MAGRAWPASRCLHAGRRPRQCAVRPGRVQAGDGAMMAGRELAREAAGRRCRFIRRDGDDPTEWVSVDARAAGAHNLWPMCLTLRRSSRHCCGRSSFLPTTTIPSPPMSRPSSVASSTTTMYRPKKRYADPAPSPHRHRCSPPSLGRSNASSSPGPSRSLVFLIHSLPLSLTRVDRLSAN